MCPGSFPGPPPGRETPHPGCRTISAQIVTFTLQTKHPDVGSWLRFGPDDPRLNMMMITPQQLMCEASVRCESESSALWENPVSQPAIKRHFSSSGVSSCCKLYQSEAVGGGGEGGIVWCLRNERSVGNWDVERLREPHSWTMAAGSLQLMRETPSPKPPLTPPLPLNFPSGLTVSWQTSASGVQNPVRCFFRVAGEL